MAGGVVSGMGWNKSHQTVYGIALNRTYLAWWESLAERNQEEQLDLVRSAFRYHPWNLDGWRRVIVLSRSSPALAEQVQTMLREMLAKGEAPAAIHLVLGTDALEQGKLPLARQHLEQAYRLDPRRIEIANNFAWVLGQVEPPELDRALRVVNEALERFPNQANLRDTRGRLYHKQKKWKEALADLEAVLPLFRGNPGLHQALADCYDQLGQKDLAAEHKRLAAQADRTP
jgi:tetratricopeptide (TPR) repeat protein